MEIIRFLCSLESKVKAAGILLPSTLPQGIVCFLTISALAADTKNKRKRGRKKKKCSFPRDLISWFNIDDYPALLISNFHHGRITREYVSECVKTALFASLAQLTTTICLVCLRTWVRHWAPAPSPREGIPSKVLKNQHATLWEWGEKSKRRNCFWEV